MSVEREMACTRQPGAPIWDRVMAASKTHLDTTFTQELVSMPERNLDDGSQLGQLLGGVGLDIGDTLKVGCRDTSQSGNRVSLSKAARSGRLLGKDDVQMSILTMFFHAVNRSIKMSEGLSS